MASSSAPLDENYYSEGKFQGEREIEAVLV